MLAGVAVTGVLMSRQASRSAGEGGTPASSRPAAEKSPAGATVPAHPSSVVVAPSLAAVPPIAEVGDLPVSTASASASASASAR